MLTAFLAYLAGVLFLGWLAHRHMSGGSFLKEYFLGNRSLGAWVLAISFGATAISGGSFMGFPALIYTHGWSLALWIAGYMVVPLVTMAVLGKRINQFSRLSGAVTIPDILRARYESPFVGLATSLILILFLGWNLVAQFKAGGLLVREAFRDVFTGWGWMAPATGAAPGAGSPPLWMGVEPGYLVGLSLFVVMVVAYTAYGGFWGVTLTDVLEGLVMLFGALTLAVLAVRAVGGIEAANQALLAEDPRLLMPGGPPRLDENGAELGDAFLPVGLAVSFFFQWTLIGMGQPGALVRLMSFRDTRAFKRAICVCAFYYGLIYSSLVVIFICARALFPLGTGPQPDAIMPFMIRRLASPVSEILAGFLLAAPYAAIMSTVAAYLLIVSSSLVRDVYHRFLRPDAPAAMIRRLSYGTTIAVGAVAFVGALRPPEFLQTIIVFSTEGLGVSLLPATALGLFWARATRSGALAGMAGGLASHLVFYWMGFVPLLYSLSISFALTVVVSLLSRAPGPRLIDRLFFREPERTQTR